MNDPYGLITSSAALLSHCIRNTWRGILRPPGTGVIGARACAMGTEAMSGGCCVFSAQKDGCSGGTCAAGRAIPSKRCFPRGCCPMSAGRSRLARPPRPWSRHAVLGVYGRRNGNQTFRALHHWYAFWHWPQTAEAQRPWLQEMDATPTHAVDLTSSSRIGR